MFRTVTGRRPFVVVWLDETYSATAAAHRPPPHTAPEQQAEESKHIAEMLEFFNEVLSKYDGVKEVGKLIGHFRGKERKKEEGSTPMCTLMWYVDPRHKHGAAVQNFLVALAEYEGGKVLVGGPPRGPLERVLSKYVDENSKK